MSPIGTVPFTHISTLAVATDSRRQSADLYYGMDNGAIHLGMFHPSAQYPVILVNVNGQDAENTKGGTGQVGAAAGAIAGTAAVFEVPGLSGIQGALDAVGVPNSIPVRWF